MEASKRGAVFRMESLTSGTVAGMGSFRCEQCGYVLTLSAEDALVSCPGCGGNAFTRASLFSARRFARENAPLSGGALEQWLEEAAREITGPGEYLAYRDGERNMVVALEREWTRVGRSLAADVRFDDPTVSRRHALIVRQPDGVRVLDDRSLNGVFVNGERVEWSTLSHGDEILVGRYRLYYLDASRLAPEPRPGLDALPSPG